MLSRSRIVTARSSSESKSKVTQKGVPITDLVPALKERLGA